MLEFIQAVMAASFLGFIFVGDGIGLAPAATWSEVESRLFIFCRKHLCIDAAVYNN
jgi:hypothetical protein